MLVGVVIGVGDVVVDFVVCTRVYVGDDEDLTVGLIEEGHRGVRGGTVLVGDTALTLFLTIASFPNNCLFDCDCVSQGLAR